MAAILILSPMIAAFAFILLFMALDIFRNRMRGRSLVTTVTKSIGLLLLAIGVAGFVGSAALASGAGKVLPHSAEMPVGSTEKAMTDSKGSVYVPLESIGRIQAYDSHLKFKRGWYVETYGGATRCRLIGDSLIEVVTSRKSEIFRYDTNGVLVSQGSYAPTRFPEPSPWNTSIRIPTHRLLLPFTSPVGGWACAMAGMIILALVDKIERRKKKRRRT